MQPYPHHYSACAAGHPRGAVNLDSPSLPTLASTSPPEFDGPCGHWSPETLLTAAVADCLVLTFRALARAAQFEWLALECRVEGTLDRSHGAACFTEFRTHARLRVPAGASTQEAQRLLERAERSCLVTNSLRALRAIDCEVVAAEPPSGSPPA